MSVQRPRNDSVSSVHINQEPRGTLREGPDEPLVERVRDERTLSKYIQLALPRFRGYRQQEDVRQADAIIRSVIANKLSSAKMQSEKLRKRAGRELRLDVMPAISETLSLISCAESEIRHAEQGYAAKNAALRVELAELTALYDADVSLIAKAAVIQEMLTELAEEPDALGQVSVLLPKVNERIDEIRKDVGSRRDRMLRIL